MSWFASDTLEDEIMTLWRQSGKSKEQVIKALSENITYICEYGV